MQLSTGSNTRSRRVARPITTLRQIAPDRDADQKADEQRQSDLQPALQRHGGSSAAIRNVRDGSRRRTDKSREATTISSNTYTAMCDFSLGYARCCVRRYPLRSPLAHAPDGGAMILSQKYTRPAKSPKEPIRRRSIKIIRSICTSRRRTPSSPSQATLRNGQI